MSIILYFIIAAIAAIFLEYIYSGTKIKKGEVWWPFIVAGLLWPTYPFFIVYYLYTRK